MGLEHHDRTTGSTALLEQLRTAASVARDLGGVVGVVVEDPHRESASADSPMPTDQFEPAAHALETGQPVEHLVGRRADLDRRQQRAPAR